MTTAKKLKLLAHKADKPGYLIDPNSVYIGFVGAILLDLASEKCINLSGDKLEVLQHTTDLSETHQMVLTELIDSKKERTLKRWVSRLGQRGRKYVKHFNQQLEQEGSIQIIKKKFLFIPYTQIQLLDIKTKAQLVHDLRSVIFNQNPLPEENEVILSLVAACKMYKAIAFNKEERKQAKLRLKEIIKDGSVSQNVDKVIKEMQAAIVATMAASTVAATAANS